MKRIQWFPFMAGILISFLSCSGDAPRISQTDWMIILTEDKGTDQIREELSLHLLAEDPDGNEDLKVMTLVSETDDYQWSFDRSAWNSRPSGNLVWVGQNRILPAGALFSSGHYTVTLEDGAGRKAETRLYIPENRISLDNTRFPKVSLSGTTLMIGQEYPQYLIWLHDSEGNLIHTRYVRGGQHSLESLIEGNPEKPASCWVFVFFEEKYTGLKTGPYVFPR